MVAIPAAVTELSEYPFSIPAEVSAGSLLAIFMLTATAFQPVAGALMGRSGRRKVFIQMGLLLTGSGKQAFLLARNFLDLFVLQMVRGVGFALTIPAAVTFVAGATQHGLGGSIGIYFTIRQIGFGLGPLVAGFLMDYSSLDAVLYTGTALVLFGLVLVHLLYKENTNTIYAPERPRFRLFDRQTLNPSILALGLTLALIIIGVYQLVPLLQQVNARLQQTSLGFSGLWASSRIGSGASR